MRVSLGIGAVPAGPRPHGGKHEFLEMRLSRRGRAPRESVRVAVPAARDARAPPAQKLVREEAVAKRAEGPIGHVAPVERAQMGRQRVVKVE